MARLPIPDGLGTRPVPHATTAALDALAAGLDHDVPAKKVGQTLIIGTWNVAIFGGFHDGWASGPGDHPRRNLTDVCAMAEVVSRFDVCALQETKRDLSALRCLIRILGGDWSFIVSDVTEGDAGNDERLCFVYDRRAVRASGLVGEVVIPLEDLGVAGDGLDRQFARTPYAVSLAAGGEGFTLVTLHALYGASKDEKQRRAHELRAIAQWLADRAHERDEFNRNLMALGDFNIDRFGDPYWLALVSTGLGAPKELDDVPRNIAFAHGGTRKYYDQIAWFGKGQAQLTLAYVTAGYVPWTDYILANAPDDDDRKAHISDHYPIWVEFDLA
jgi:endonuclease/exonuclease/phosphatase family metal-dependent hydrolase